MRSDFCTMCNGEDHGLLDLLTTPCLSRSANSFLAASSLAGSRRRYLELTGREHVVSITCCTRCFTGGKFLEALTTSGNSATTSLPSSPTPAASPASPSHCPVPRHEGVEHVPDVEVEVVEDDVGGLCWDVCDVCLSAATTPTGAAVHPGGGAANGT